MSDTQIDDLTEIQQLAEEYASYSMSKSGLANVWGGSVGIAIYLLNGLLKPGIWITILTIVLTLSWLGSKGLIRMFLYRPFGEAREKWSARQQRNQVLLAVFLSFCTVLLWFGLLDGYFRRIIPLIQLVSGLVVAASMPLIAWRYFHNTDEITVGVFLLISCVLVSSGSLLGEGPDSWLLAAWMPIYALMLLWRGLEEHWQFRRLAKRLREQGEVC